MPDTTILGVNHQFMYPASITDAKVHTETLKKVAANEDVAALDCWIWRDERAEEETKILLDSGKVINYNIGDRFGEKGAIPASANPKEQEHAYGLLMREIGHALKVNAKKIIFASGPDFPDDHEGALERLFEFIMKIGRQVPKDVTLAFEPTDWDIDKFFLCGRMEETTDLIHKLRKAGLENIGMLLDMGHIPIMHETLESAVAKAEDTLVHIHLGNALIKNPASPFYGDKHIPWGYPEAEYTEADGIRYIQLLRDSGYFQKENTVSFEMRPIEGLSPEESLKRWVKVWQQAQI